MNIQKKMWVIVKDDTYYTGRGLTKFSDHFEEAVLFDELDKIPIFEDEGESYKQVSVVVTME